MPGDACPCAVPGSRAPAASRWTSSRLGTKYAEALDLKVLDENGKAAHIDDGLVRRRCLAGRGLQQRRGQPRRTGLIWPRALAPADVHVVVTGKDETVATYGEGSLVRSRRAVWRCCSTTAARPARV